MTTTKNCPMCRLKLGRPDGMIANKDDAGLVFVFAICTNCSTRDQRWSPASRKQQLRAPIGLLAMNPSRYNVKTFDSKAAAWIYTELEIQALKEAKHD